jgi:hypothetical protein
MSSIAAWDEFPELRLTAYAEPNPAHWFSPKTPASVRLMPASPNSTGPGLVPDGFRLSFTVARFTRPSANPRSLMIFVSPQHPLRSSSC